MLSLDIWIEKLAHWQENGYKLEMPKREMVDSLKWHHTLKFKLKEALKYNQNAQRNPQNETIPVKIDANLKAQESLKRNYQAMSKQAPNQMEDPEAFRKLKQKKLNESHMEIRNGSIISTDKTSDLSSLVRIPKPQFKKPKVNMVELLAKIKTLKAEVIKNVEDKSSKNIVELSSLDSNRI